MSPGPETVCYRLADYYALAMAVLLPTAAAFRSLKQPARRPAVARSAVVDSGVRGGLIGLAPSLVDLDDGDPKSSVDFRRVYASALRPTPQTAPSRCPAGKRLEADPRHL